MYIKSVFFILMVFGFCSPLMAQLKVACVGNSITENNALPAEQRYPAILQRLLGNGYDVRNYGVSARTMLKKGDHPYWNEQQYQDALAWHPDIVIIKMGTNDAKPGNWQYKDDFVKDYVAFVNSFKSLPSKPKVYICYPIPTFPNNYLPVDDRLMVEEVIPRVQQVADITKSTVIDLHTPLLGKTDFVYDTVHPNEKGTTVMARVIAKTLLPKRNFPKPANLKVDVVFIGNSITQAGYLKHTPPDVTALDLDSMGYDVQYANCGISGYTTADFLPGSKAYQQVVNETRKIYKGDELLIFSLKLGTNDSAIKGPNGAPASPESYRKNMQLIIDSLHQNFPQAKFLLQSPLWYSPNTHNSSTYLQEGLDRLKSYRPEIRRLAKANPAFVSIGDQKGFDVFRRQYKYYLKPEAGNSGTFYLHPNQKGATILGGLWARSIDQYIHNLKKEHKSNVESNRKK